jgi:rhodanese-related sulfurtransferase
MFDLFKKTLGLGHDADFPALLKEGAQIVDVRTMEEFRDGHINGAVNIPVQNLPHRLADIRKDRAVITCCASGMRSAAAKRILEAGGFPQVHNGGGWRSLKGRIQETKAAANRGGALQK